MPGGKELTLSQKSGPSPSGSTQRGPHHYWRQSRDGSKASALKPVLGPFAGLPPWHRQAQVAGLGYGPATQRRQSVDKGLGPGSVSSCLSLEET